jgi:hypothetical protein
VSNTAEFDRQLEENRRAYAALRDEIRTKYTGQYVGLAFGKIVAFDPDFERVCAIIDNLQPSPAHCSVFRADDDPSSDLTKEFWTENA